MSDTSELGILYTEHAGLTATTPVASLWSYETRSRGRERRSVVLNADGSREYWLDRSDPLLNTILPGTGVSLIVNFGDPWAAGRSLATSRLLPRVCVVGPVTQARILRVGRSVHAMGAVLQTTLTPDVFGIPAAELIDRIAPLQDLWPRMDVERLLASLSCLEIRWSLSALRDELVARVSRPSGRDTVGQTASRLIKFYGGQVSIDDMARSHGLSRQQFARQFWAASGLSPKLFARITRFQKLVHVLLSTDVSKWASVSPSVGFYDQAHMINEFRAFAGSPPTDFFRPHGGNIDPTMIQLRGRPCEWLRLPVSLAANEPARLRGGDQKELASTVAGVCSKT
jgi:AraC-like DNA-binding protein